jgi:hypothetical protein
MDLTNIQYLHSHSNKSTIVKLIFSIILSIIIIFLIQPIWLYKYTIDKSQLKKCTNDSELNNCISKEIKWPRLFLLLLLLVIFIYKFVINCY